MPAYRFGPFLLSGPQSLWMGEALIPLSPQQSRLLTTFCLHPQQVIEKKRLIREVWCHADVSDVTLARAVHGLRHRLAVGLPPQELIRNIYGTGYVFTESVETLPTPAAEPSRATASVA